MFLTEMGLEVFAAENAEMAEALEEGTSYSAQRRPQYRRYAHCQAKQAASARQVRQAQGRKPLIAQPENNAK